MGILKAINAKNSGRKGFLDTLEYVSNTEKTPMTDNSDRAGKFEKTTFVNRKLHGKENSKRQFKQFIVSLSVVWPTDANERESLRKKLDSVTKSAEIYFMCQGFRAAGWIHCNTKHPHFHLLLETCNAVDGKQYSQSKSDLSDFKSYISTQLLCYGLNEEILTDVKNITEEELFQEEIYDCMYQNDDGGDYADDAYYDDDTLESRKDFLSEIKKWNSGTMELVGKTMCKIVDNDIPDESGVKKERMREMFRIVKPDEKREMCRIIEPGEKRIMFRIVDKKQG